MVDNLKDTVEGMLSLGHKERFKAEYQQLELRASRLNSILRLHENGALSFEPACPIPMLECQYNAMMAYLYCLQARAEIEGIDLGD